MQPPHIQRVVYDVSRVQFPLVHIRPHGWSLVPHAAVPQCCQLPEPTSSGARQQNQCKVSVEFSRAEPCLPLRMTGQWASRQYWAAFNVCAFHLAFVSCLSKQCGFFSPWSCYLIKETTFNWLYREKLYSFELKVLYSSIEGISSFSAICSANVQCKFHCYFQSFNPF